MSLRSASGNNTTEIKIPFNDEPILNVYADMGNEIVNIQYSGLNPINLKIIDSMGQLIKSEVIFDSFNSIDYSNYESGVYYAVVFDMKTGNKMTLPFVKL